MIVKVICDEIVRFFFIMEFSVLSIKYIKISTKLKFCKKIKFQNIK